MIEGGGVGLLAQEVSTFAKDAPSVAPTIVQFAHGILAQEVSTFEKDDPLAAPTKAQCSKDVWDHCWEQRF